MLEERRRVGRVGCRVREVMVSVWDSRRGRRGVLGLRWSLGSLGLWFLVEKTCVGRFIGGGKNWLFPGSMRGFVLFGHTIRKLGTPRAHLRGSRYRLR